MDERKRILLVEDNPDHAYLAKAHILWTGGYVISEVSTGKDALDEFETDMYDLSLLDYDLPDMNGLIVLQHMVKKSAHFPVIMMTGRGSESIAVQAMKDGAYDYIVKSSDHYKDLPLLLQKAFEKYELLRLNEALKQKLEEQARKDLLTGTINKNYFCELYARELERAKRYKGKLAVVMIDIDNFKTINDTCGHLVGDSVLVKIGGILKRCCRSTDIVARYGGDEFVIVILEAGAEKARSLTSRIRAAIKSLNAEIKLPIEVSISMGVRVSNGDYEALLESADRDMYRYKKEYYNCQGDKT